MTFLEAVERSPIFLSDGGIETRIAFETDIPLDPADGGRPAGRGRAGAGGDGGGLSPVPRRGPPSRPPDAGRHAHLPGRPRAAAAGRVTDPDDLDRVHGECFRLLTRLREGFGDYGKKVFIAGVVGPKGDAYRPEEAAGRGRGPRLPPAQVGRWPGGRRPPLRPDLPGRLGGPRRGKGHGRGRACPTSSARSSPPGGGCWTARRWPRSSPGSTGPSRPGPPITRLAASILRSSGRPCGPMRGCADGGGPPARDQGERLHEVAGGAGGPEPPRCRGTGAARRPDHGAAGEFGLRVLGGCCGTDHRHIEALARRLAAERT